MLIFVPFSSHFVPRWRKFRNGSPKYDEYRDNFHTNLLNRFLINRELREKGVWDRQNINSCMLYIIERCIKYCVCIKWKLYTFWVFVTSNSSLFLTSKSLVSDSIFGFSFELDGYEILFVLLKYRLQFWNFYFFR